MDRVSISLDQWKQQAAEGQAPAQALLLKQFVPDQIKAAGDESSRKLTFVISTGAIDRDRDTLSVEGWGVEAYLKNPVVLWAHFYGSPPVAKAESVVKSAGALRATAEFATAEEYPFAETVFRLLKGGYLRATSVGFRPVKWAYNEERRGYDFQEQELLEFSVVPVPANPEALLEAKAGGIPLLPLKAWAEQILDGLEPGMWVPKDVALRVLKVATGEPASTSVPPAPTATGKAAEDTPPAEPPPEPKTFVETLPPFLKDPEKLRQLVRGALSDAAHAQVRRARGRLD